jgi:hypothetical protein
MSTEEQNISIAYYMDEIENNNSDLDIEELLNEIENSQLNNDEMTIPQIINYTENFTIKELLLICEYYGFAKDLKSNKCNKNEIIHVLVDFERNENNSDIVFRRQNMWFYMNELKNDKFMKKYVLW